MSETDETRNKRQDVEETRLTSRDGSEVIRRRGGEGRGSEAVDSGRSGRSTEAGRDPWKDWDRTDHNESDSDVSEIEEVRRSEESRYGHPAGGEAGPQRYRAEDHEDDRADTVSETGREGLTESRTRHQRLSEVNPEKHDSKELGQKLVTGGEEVPGAGYEAHHIIPGKAFSEEDEKKDPRLQELRVKLDDMHARAREAGIGMNDAANGVWLVRDKNEQNVSGGTVHQEGVHQHNIEKSGPYIEELHRRLDGKRNEAFAEELAKAKDQLKTGQLMPWHRGE